MDCVDNWYENGSVGDCTSCAGCDGITCEFCPYGDFKGGCLNDECAFKDGNWRD